MSNLYNVFLLQKQLSYSEEIPLDLYIFRVSGDFSGCAISDVGETVSAEGCLLLFKLLDDNVMFCYADFPTFRKF
jgi:hypothetical protein